MESEFTNGNESNDSNNGKKNNDEDKRPNDANNDNRCPICLNVIRNRSVTDNCSHEFCFECINQWSQYHNHCPYCTQIYNNIIFNIVSDEEYEQIPVNQPVNQDIQEGLNAIAQQMLPIREHLIQLERRVNRLIERNIAREANRPQMAVLDAINGHNNNNANEDNDDSDTDSTATLRSNSSNDSHDSGSISDDEESGENLDNGKQNIRRKRNANRSRRNRWRNNRNGSKRSSNSKNKRRKQ